MLASDLATISPYAGVQVTDVDVGKTETATVTLDQVGNGQLVDTVGGSYDAVHGIYTATGTDAAVTADLKALQFQPTDHQVTPGQSVTSGLTLIVSDDHGGSATLATSIVATAAEDAPVISGGVSALAISDAAGVNPYAGVQVTDVDVGKTETATVTLDQVGNGQLVDTVGGSYDAVHGIYTATGTDAAVTADLKALQFQPTDHQVTPGQSVTSGLTLIVSDDHGGSATLATSIVATAAEDAPVISGGVSALAISDAAGVNPYAGVQVTDVDVGKTETATVTLDQVGNGQLVDTVGGSYDAVHGIYTATGTDAAVTADLKALQFQPTDHQVTPGQSVTSGLTLIVSDDHGGSATLATSIVATAAEDAPVISGGVSALAISDAAGVNPYAGVQVTDVDVGKTETATVTLDQVGNGQLVDTVGGSYDAVHGIYTATGTDAAVTADLKALQFQPTDHQVTPGQSVTSGLTLIVSDDHGGSATLATSIVATAAEDAPVISFMLPAVVASEGSTVQPLIGVQVLDADVGKIETATVTLDQPSNGVLSDAAGGSYDPMRGVFTVTADAAALSTDLQSLQLRLAPQAGAQIEPVTTILSLKIDDGYGGTAIATTMIVGVPVEASKGKVHNVNGTASSSAGSLISHNDNTSVTHHSGVTSSVMSYAGELPLPGGQDSASTLPVVTADAQLLSNVATVSPSSLQHQHSSAINGNRLAEGRFVHVPESHASPPIPTIDPILTPSFEHPSMSVSPDSPPNGEMAATINYFSNARSFNRINGLSSSQEPHRTNSATAAPTYARAEPLTATQANCRAILATASWAPQDLRHTPTHSFQPESQNTDLIGHDVSSHVDHDYTGHVSHADYGHFPSWLDTHIVH